MNHRELQGLLVAAKEECEDDLPRWILADWLEENGDPRRAEFVRLQCQRAALPADDPQRPMLFARERALLAINAANWIQGLKRFTRFSTFERGMLFLDVRTLDSFLHDNARAQRLSPAYPWVAGIQCRCGSEDRLLTRLLRQADVLAGLTHFQLGTSGGSKKLAELVASPHLHLVSHLDLGHCPLGDEGATALARSPHLRRLRVLGLSHTGMTDAGLAELVRSPNLRRLRVLSLSGNPISDDGAELLTDANLSELKELDLCQQPLSPRLSSLGLEVLRQRFGAGFHFFGLSLPPLYNERHRRP